MLLMKFCLESNLFLMKRFFLPFLQVNDFCWKWNIFSIFRDVVQSSYTDIYERIVFLLYNQRKKNESVFSEDLNCSSYSPSFTEYTVKISQLPCVRRPRYLCINFSYSGRKVFDKKILKYQLKSTGMIHVGQILMCLIE